MKYNDNNFIDINIVPKNVSIFFNRKTSSIDELLKFFIN